MEVEYYRDSGELSDFCVSIGNREFRLHKFPLFIKSEFFKEIVQQADHADFEDFPGGALTFSLVADFCYGKCVTFTLENIVGLRCAAEFLEMKGNKNLDHLSDVYLDDVIETFRRSQSLLELHSLLDQCRSVGNVADRAKITEKCFHALLKIWPTGCQRVQSLWTDSQWSKNLKEEERYDDKSFIDTFFSMSIIRFIALIKSCSENSSGEKLYALANIVAKFLSRLFGEEEKGRRAKLASSPENKGVLNNLSDVRASGSDTPPVSELDKSQINNDQESRAKETKRNTNEPELKTENYKISNENVEKLKDGTSTNMSNYTKDGTESTTKLLDNIRYEKDYVCLTKVTPSLETATQFKTSDHIDNFSSSVPLESTEQTICKPIKSKAGLQKFQTLNSATPKHHKSNKSHRNKGTPKRRQQKQKGSESDEFSRERNMTSSNISNSSIMTSTSIPLSPHKDSVTYTRRSLSTQRTVRTNGFTGLVSTPAKNTSTLDSVDVSRDLSDAPPLRISRQSVRESESESIFLPLSKNDKSNTSTETLLVPERPNSRREISSSLSLTVDEVHIESNGFIAVWNVQDIHFETTNSTYTTTIAEDTEDLDAFCPPTSKQLSNCSTDEKAKDNTSVGQTGNLFTLTIDRVDSAPSTGLDIAPYRCLSVSSAEDELILTVEEQQVERQLDVINGGEAASHPDSATQENRNNAQYECGLVLAVEDKQDTIYVDASRLTSASRKTSKAKTKQRIPIGEMITGDLSYVQANQNNTLTSTPSKQEKVVSYVTSHASNMATVCSLTDDRVDKEGFGIGSGGGRDSKRLSSSGGGKQGRSTKIKCGSKYRDDSEGNTSKSVGEVLDEIIEALPDNTPLSDVIGGKWIRQAIEIATSYQCQCRDRLLLLAGNVFHLLRPEEIHEIGPEVLCELVRTSLRGAKVDQGVLIYLLEDYFVETTRSGRLSAQDFVKILRSIPNEVRPSSDVLLVAIEPLLISGMTAEECKALIGAINLAQCHEETLQRALDRQLVPPEILCQAALVKAKLSGLDSAAQKTSRCGSGRRILPPLENDSLYRSSPRTSPSRDHSAVSPHRDIRSASPGRQVEWAARTRSPPLVSPRLLRSAVPPLRDYNFRGATSRTSPRFLDNSYPTTTGILRSDNVGRAGRSLYNLHNVREFDRGSRDFLAREPRRPTYEIPDLRVRKKDYDSNVTLLKNLSPGEFDEAVREELERAAAHYNCYNSPLRRLGGGLRRF